MQPIRILVVDDDPHIREVLRFALEQAGMVVEEAADGAAALAMLERRSYDLVVLDVLMPELDGLEVCRRVRAQTSDEPSGGAGCASPILFLSSRTEEVDRVLGLELGGDDYMTKPFSPRELVARIHAILRRTGAMAAGAGQGAHASRTNRAGQEAPSSSTAVTYARGCLTVDPEAHTAIWRRSDSDDTDAHEPSDARGDAVEVPLTATELALLTALARRPRKIFTREELMDAALGPDGVISERTIDSHIRHIRAKFAELGAANVVETAHGLGYRLGACR